MKSKGFDRIAFIYDFLAKLVFGKSVVDSQMYFLNRIKEGSKILILGGGTGWLLDELLKRKPHSEVWYIDASEKMISLAKSKTQNEKTIHFIHGTEQDIPASIKYDTLITNFYLDLFTDLQLTDVISKLKSSMKPGATWMITDFIDNKKWWQAVMLKMMYWFFRITCHIESQQLPEWNGSVERAGVKEIGSKTFYKGFIKASFVQL